MRPARRLPVERAGRVFRIHRRTVGLRQQNRVAGARERRTALLYGMSRELAGTRGSENMARVAVTHVAEDFDSAAVVLTPEATGRLRYPAGSPLER